jgi:hypothetical protein
MASSSRGSARNHSNHGLSSPGGRSVATWDGGYGELRTHRSRDVGLRLVTATIRGYGRCFCGPRIVLSRMRSLPRRGWRSSRFLPNLLFDRLGEFRNQLAAFQDALARATLPRRLRVARWIHQRSGWRPSGTYPSRRRPRRHTPSLGPPEAAASLAAVSEWPLSTAVPMPQPGLLLPSALGFITRLQPFP